MNEHVYTPNNAQLNQQGKERIMSEMRKPVCKTTSMMLLLVMLAFALGIRIVRADETIYIRADGSIEPLTAPITSLDNVTYTFTDNIYDSVVIERSNIIIDGGGYTVEGSGIGNGFSLYSISNVTIKNTNIRSFAYGIYLESTSQNTISENNITASDYDGIGLSDSLNNSITRNKIIANNWFGIGLYYSSNNSISWNNLTNNYDGIEFYDSSSNNISGNSIEANVYFGIEVYYSSNNHIFINRVANNEYGGIELSFSPDNSIFHNNFINNTKHASVTSGDNNAWDNGYPFGGNYWDDYTGEDLNGDGIGETPYVIGENNIDHVVLIDPYVPDAAITKTTPSKTVVGQSYTVNIDITIANQGNYMENLNFTVYANTTAIGSQALTLTRWTSITITLTWNTTGFVKGNYTISAYVWPVPGETDIGDNRKEDGCVIVTYVGDFNGDFIVNYKDDRIFGWAYIAYGQTGEVDPRCDLNEDGKIDYKDDRIFGWAYIAYGRG
jgi:parallel beta-helix repeat protein